MTKHDLFLAVCFITFFSCQNTPIAPTSSTPTETFKIAFGSCGWEEHPLPIFYEVVKHQPDVFVFLGDNIYGDTYEMDTLKAKYAKLGAKESYQHLKANVPLFATWDDHDFGWNDAGRHYKYKEEAKAIMFDFFEEPADSERRKRAGIYDSYFYKLGDKKIQIILLDTRTFRDDILKHPTKKSEDRRYFYPLDYTPHTTTDSTFLGEAQWAWLDQELQKEADIRIIGSSTQFGIEYNGYEAWANFPHEQQRFLDLIKKNKTNGLMFISGDVHYAEISQMEVPDLYPIYDVTSSGLSSKWYFATPNVHRIEGPIMENHFGMLTLDLLAKKPMIIMEIWDIKGNQRVEHIVPLSELSF